MNFLELTVMALAAVIFGFCLGRIPWEKESESEENAGEKSVRERAGKGKISKGGRAVGSPVSGEVQDMREGEHPEVVIHPSEDRLYAPAGGKITKLFPMGNALLFRTEFGAELYIQAGDVQDELLGEYFRPRIVQNEIVGKGKLLLEFDRKGLEAEGASPKVSVMVKNDICGSDILTMTGEKVKSGEEILRVNSESI